MANPYPVAFLRLRQQSLSRPVVSLSSRKWMGRTWSAPWVWPVLGALVIAGVAMRGVAWAWGRSLDGDELSLYLNLRAFEGWRLVSGQLNATPSTQAGPPVFLWLLDLLADRMSPGQVAERVLRLLPLAASLLVLPAAGLAATLTGRRARVPLWPIVLLTVGGLAVSERLIDVTQRLKQYSGDVLATLLLISAALAVLDRGPWVRRLTLAIVAGGLAWWSHPVLLVYPTLLCLDVLADLRLRRRHFASAIAAALLAGAMMLPVALAAVGQRDPFLDDFWQFGFAPWGTAWWVPFWVGDTWLELVEYGLRPLAGLLVPLALAGLVWLWRRPRIFAALAAAPLAVTVAGLTHVYPLVSQRVDLFVIPAVLLLAGVGAAVMLAGPPRRWETLWAVRSHLRLTTAGVLALVLSFAVVRAGRGLFEPPPDVAPAVQAAVALGLPIIAFDEPTAWHLRVYRPNLPLLAVWRPRKMGAVPGTPPVAVVIVGPKPGGDDAPRLKDALKIVPAAYEATVVPISNRSSVLLRLTRRAATVEPSTRGSR